MLFKKKNNFIINYYLDTKNTRRTQDLPGKGGKESLETKKH